MKCDTCLNSRWIVFETGAKSVCTLSSERATKCLSGKEDMHIELYTKEIIDNRNLTKENKQGVLEQIAENQKTLLDTTKAWSDYIDKNGYIY